MKQCPYCGNYNQKQSQFCTICGAPLPATGVYPPQFTSVPPRRRRWPIVLAVTAGILLLVAAVSAALVLLLRSVRKEPLPVSVAVTDVTPTPNGTSDPGRYTLISPETETASPSLEPSPSAAPTPSPTPTPSAPPSEPASPSSGGDVESKVLRIREVYNTIQDNISGGIYTKLTVRDGLTAYFDGEQLVCLIAARDDSYSRDRYLYYDNGELIFAYYEGDDAYRFYLDNGELIRIRYAPVATKPAESSNEDNPDNFGKWLGYINQHSDLFSQEAYDALR